MDYPIRTLQQLRPLLVGFRKQAGLSQAALASLLGVTQQSYAKIEANPASTSVDRLFTILRLLGSEIVLSKHEQPETKPPAASIDSGGGPAPAAPKRTKTALPAPPKIIPPTKQKERW
jgi:HTH-type transcriptional regulator/antitoxin HipB